MKKAGQLFTGVSPMLLLSGTPAGPVVFQMENSSSRTTRFSFALKLAANASLDA